MDMPALSLYYLWLAPCQGTPRALPMTTVEAFAEMPRYTRLDARTSTNIYTSFM